MTPFNDIRAYVGTQRVLSLRLSPDGQRLVAAVQALNSDGKSYGTSLWSVPTSATGGHPRRLTRSAKGESGAAFTPDGDLLFTSRRPDPGGEGDEDVPALWLLPADGGEARKIADRPGGIAEVRAGGSATVFLADVLPGDASLEAERRKARKDAGISAVLHEGYPVRYWDADLGPGQRRMFAATGGAGESLDGVEDVTPDPGRALDNASFDVTPDGAAAVTTWWNPQPNAEMRTDLVRVDLAGRTRRTLAAQDGYDFTGPVRISPDGRYVTCLRESHSSPDRVPEITLCVIDLGTGDLTVLGGDLWPGDVAWAPDSASLYAVADHRGRRPVFRYTLDGAEPVRLTPDDAAYYSLCPAPDGTGLYALRSGVGITPGPVRIALDGTVEELPSPALRLDLPGTLTEISAPAPDGTEIRSWLVLPEGASSDEPAPLLLWVHGGPVASWNDWSWRWNPWIMAAAGYAVLLPDPCLSSGYGSRMLERGWADWGPATEADLMAVTAACQARPDIDESRTGLMGGSFGGYMANWLAGHTTGWKAVVTHASLWHLDQFAGTTDVASYWEREFGPVGSDLYRTLSPHTALENISAPMLVIHGDKDYRVPIGEALRLWRDLQRTGVEGKFLYFPDENHWILKPGNIVAWYETCLAFLAQHVLGQEWKRPESLA
ncbi:S9 family peptidase [Sinosporangium siamense]|uniref:Peptidase S9 n=1 Tax=Sinosporangium siamense TaxID=1367973 RepID=A0A919RDP6_9ACTN|nr:prolyl oligopeptidase family serine peptidase [Sinosporangium siamense]GII91978.1 peptidase S9 [Sinosporangium siamense]